MRNIAQLVPLGLRQEMLAGSCLTAAMTGVVGIGRDIVVGAEGVDDDAAVIVAGRAGPII